MPINFKFIVFIVFLFINYRVIAQPNASPVNEIVIQTESGKVRGRMEKKFVVFKNIPYAAPPAGDLYFAAPVKHRVWNEIRDATKSGPTAPFIKPKEVDIDDKPIFGNGWIKGSDYLTVNIWAPRKSNRGAPVMVFIHGGAFVLGTADVPMYDGASFAKKGIVLVTLNYRLGIEGFLKINGVPTNLGIRDQIAALQWVKDNIASFGGDPSNVTIFGESAGAMAVGVLIVCPAAKGLFTRAIMLSGSAQSVLSSEQADIITGAYTKTLKIENTREAWLKFTPEQLLHAQGQVKSKSLKLKTKEYEDPTGGLVLFYPVIDGDIVPDIPLKEIEKGAAKTTDLLIGYNTDEMNYFLIPSGLQKKIKLNLILNIAVKKVHPAPSAIISVYKAQYPKKKLGEIFSAITTAYQFQVPAIRIAELQAKQNDRTYMYEFNWKSSVSNGTYGAYHGIGLPFLFNHLKIVTGVRGMLGPNGASEQLADKIQDAFIAFAKNGSPGWETYNNTEHKTMLINNTWILQRNPHEKEIISWDVVR
ncbi:MAG: carboxylesterase family protein [Chitinophagaceae bacterium]